MQKMPVWRYPPLSWIAMATNVENDATRFGFGLVDRGVPRKSVSIGDLVVTKIGLFPKGDWWLRRYKLAKNTYAMVVTPNLVHSQTYSPHLVGNRPIPR